MMVARFAGASLGLLAFTITIVAGLFAHNPVAVTLSRSILALFLFCILGLVLGTAAQFVIAEYEQNRESEIRKRYSVDSTGTAGGGAKDGSNEAESGSTGG